MKVARVRVKPDTLDEENRKFVQVPLKHPLFLNSVPKSGSHLLRNIIRMFVPVEQQYQAEFIQYQFLDQHFAAFDLAANRLSWGHMFFMDPTQAALRGVRHILLVRTRTIGSWPKRVSSSAMNSRRAWITSKNPTSRSRRSSTW